MCRFSVNSLEVGSQVTRDTEKYREEVNQIIEDYLETWKAPYSTLAELNGMEREELLGVIQDELGIVIQKADFDELVDEDTLTVDDIVGAVTRGLGMEDEE